MNNTGTYTTRSGESVAGIALRELGSEKRWREIADLNAGKFPEMLGADYYPVGTVLMLPVTVKVVEPKYFCVLIAAIRNNDVPFGEHGHYYETTRDDPDANEFRAQSTYMPTQGGFSFPLGSDRETATHLMHMFNKCFDIGVTHAQRMAADQRTEPVLPGRMGYLNRNEESMP